MPPAPYNLARFDFVSVRLAVACAQTGSLTAGARDCNIVLAAASRRIRELESAVGDTLFERHSRGLVPTPAGRAFVRHELVLLREMDTLVAELADIRQGVARQIRLCSSTAAINQFLPPLLARYAQLHAAVRVDVEEQVSELVIVALREGRADIGAFVAGPDTQGLEATDFRTDELVLILPRRHPLAGRTPIPFVETLDEEWISLTSGAALLQQQHQAALAAGRTLKLRMQGAQLRRGGPHGGLGTRHRRAAEAGVPADHPRAAPRLAATVGRMGPAPAPGRHPARCRRGQRHPSGSFLRSFTKRRDSSSKRK